MFKVSHKKNYKLKMRMGIHTGTCVGAVLGSKMPHFSVFGDTVNITALIESTSEPMKIQISQTTQALLENLGGFNCRKHGQVEVPRSDPIITYWLVSQTSNTPSTDGPEAQT